MVVFCVFICVMVCWGLILRFTCLRLPILNRNISEPCSFHGFGFLWTLWCCLWFFCSSSTFVVHIEWSCYAHAGHTWFLIWLVLVLSSLCFQLLWLVVSVWRVRASFCWVMRCVDFFSMAIFRQMQDCIATQTIGGRVKLDLLYFWNTMLFEYIGVSVPRCLLSCFVLFSLSV